MSYRAFHQNCARELGKETWVAYLLGGGSPLGCNDIYQFERIPEHLIQLVRDWVFGEIVASGRSRVALGAALSSLYRYGGTPVGYTKLARESGMANNTVASGYIEQLSDLLTVLPAWAYNPEKENFELRKPAKFHFINISAAVAFHPQAPRHVHEFHALDDGSRATLLEWLVAQELWRRNALAGRDNPEALGYWQSDRHEIDFAGPDGTLIEVKAGKASALEFGWFRSRFPRQELTVICTTPFESRAVRGVTLHDFLLGL